jgi:hypothetical protein
MKNTTGGAFVFSLNRRYKGDGVRGLLLLL